MDNITIKLKKSGETLYSHSGHNVWTDDGREYLAKLLSLVTFDPDTYITSARVKYMGLGVGGNKQTFAAVDSAPYTTYYPAGANTPPSTGKEYNPDFPIQPLIRSLERPIITFSADGVSAYPGTAGDQYVFPVSVFYQTPQVVEFMVDLNIGASTVLLSPFTEMPLSEIGLFLSTSSPSNAFNVGKCVAYHAFDTLLVTSGIDLEISWKALL